MFERDWLAGARDGGWSLWTFIVVGALAALFVVLLAHEQIAVWIYKMALLTSGATLAWLLDHAFFRLGKLGVEEITEPVRIALIQRRGVMIAAGMVGMALAL